MRLQTEKAKILAKLRDMIIVLCGFMMLALKAGSLPCRVFISAVILLLDLARLNAGTIPPIQTVFVILLENESWAEVEGSTNAPYLNTTLLPMASRCKGYYNVSNLHPSLPNYLWLEAGTNFGILDNDDPDTNHQNTTNHFVTLLKNAGISWKTYHEDIDGTFVPLTNRNGYAVRHNPFVYFDDVTGTNNPAYAYGISHVRPYSELAADLTNNTVARYNFLKPNVCNDGHDSCPPFYDSIRQIDAWLAAEVPKILNSQAYQNNGALFITWDESHLPDPRIGMIVPLTFSPRKRLHEYHLLHPQLHTSHISGNLRCHPVARRRRQRNRSQRPVSSIRHPPPRENAFRRDSHHCSRDYTRPDQCRPGFDRSHHLVADLDKCFNRHNFRHR